MTTKYNITVKNKDGKTVEVVKRVLRAKAIGNFNPIFCRYNGREYLVDSTEGDLSDPFRRDSTYLDHLYIEIE